MTVSVIVPTLDEERAVEAALRSARGADELIVVDGGSRDATVAMARHLGARVVQASRGRGRQLARGAELAHGDVLLFLHADTVLPPGYVSSVTRALGAEKGRWGRFDLRFDSGGPLLRLIAWLISRRSRWTRVATGDQAIFVTRELFDAAGGFCEELLFEDVDLCRRLRVLSPMVVPAGYVVTSARRWRSGGTWRTTFRMWTLKLLYLAGVPSERLARGYRDAR